MGVSARILYRYGLGSQFLWAALQALEKYLKAILLYNNVSSKNVGHDIEKDFAKLTEIRDIPFFIASNVKPRDYEVELVVGSDGRVTEAELRGRGLSREQLDRVRHHLLALNFERDGIAVGRYVLKIRATELAKINPPQTAPETSYFEEAPEPLRKMD